jgi:dihydrofolate synthase/folylpolyglutamate synthase
VTYDETLAYLIGLEAVRGWDLKLERVREALARLGSPERRYPSVLIAGTNGKGSTAAFTHAALTAQGLRVGLYTSPHLVHFTERIRIGSAEIEREQVVSGIERIRSVAPPEQSGLTFFEVTTLLAFLQFAEEQIDAAVLEVGLGGRLDATNVVEPCVSAIVSIGRDHEDYLGTTLAAIAREKAGVLRPGRPVVIGSGIAGEARAAIEEEAARSGARIVEGRAFEASVPEIALAGLHMRGNAAVALGVLHELGAAVPRLRVTEEALRQGFASARWPGRLEIVRRSPLVLCDGAHNREAAAALAASLPSLVGDEPVRLIFGALRDKPWREMAAELRPLVGEVALVPIRSPRSASVADLATAFPAEKTTTFGSAEEALASLLEQSSSAPIVVAGSLFLLGEIYAGLLGARPGASVFSAAPWEGRI